MRATASVSRQVRKTLYAQQLSVVSLAGRKQLCVNEDVRSLSGSERVNEACLDLQAGKSKQARGGKANRGGGGGGGGASGDAKGCPYLQSSTSSDRHKLASRAVADRLLLEPLDVEELSQVGRGAGCCAYYAARGALPDAQLVLLPYSSLLHAGTRQALGVSLDRSVVVIDEAHNLIDTINEAHSVTLTARALSE